MLVPTTFSLKTSGKITYLFWGLFTGAGVVFLLSVLFITRHASHTWLEYVFVLLIILLLSFAAVTWLLKAFQSNLRIEVNEEGFTYNGLLETCTILWKDVVSVKHVYDRGNFDWLAIKVKQGSGKTKTFKLDFTGLSPDYTDFIRQARTCASSADFGVFGLHQRKPRSPVEAKPQSPNPVYEKLRQDTRQLSATEGREGLLAGLDRLEESERAIQHYRAGEAEYQARKQKMQSLSALLVLAVAIGLGVYLYQIISSGQSENHNNQMVYLSSDPVVFWLNLFFPIFIFIVSVVGLFTMVFLGRTSGKTAGAERNIHGNGVGRKQANPQEPMRGNASQ
jgi:hypothetical protein